jgi:hypothetical protein
MKNIVIALLLLSTTQAFKLRIADADIDPDDQDLNDGPIKND